ncbi:MAG TPA: DUF4232 domain-containing protein [Streptosporangiaceae bacterium]
MINTSRAVRRAAAVTGVACGALVAAALLAACGSTSGQPGAAGSGASAPSAGSPGGAGSGGAASASPAGSGAALGSQCPSSALHVTVDTAQGSAAAGTDYVPLDFTNVSGHSCVMYGFPGVSFVTGHPGSQIGDSAARQTTFGSRTVTLAASGTAHAWLGIADAGNFPAASCHQVTAHWLRIYPPDQFDPLYVSYSTPVCSAKITGGSTPLMILPVRSGKAAAQSVP